MSRHQTTEAMSKTEGETNPSYDHYSPFVRLLGTPGRARILDAFLRKYRTELSAGDVASLTHVSESTFSRNKDVLLELDIIIPTREVGSKQYYQLNLESPIVELLGRFHTQLLDYADYIAERTTISDEEYIGRLMMVKSAKTERKQGDRAEKTEHVFMEEVALHG